MKSPFLFILSSLCLTASLLAGEVATTWPGVKYQVSDIKRLDDTHVLMVVRLKSDGTASEPITIGDLPNVTKPAKVSKSGKRSSNDDEELPRAFSLTTARMLDEATNREFTALPSLPPKPYFGPNAMVTTLGPGGWIQMAVCFNAPPPLPVGANGKAPQQKVTVLFPRAVKPMTGLVLPSTTGKADAAKP